MKSTTRAGLAGMSCLRTLRISGSDRPHAGLRWLAMLLTLVGCSSWLVTAEAGELYAGAATISITPDQPVALWGQMHTRISRGVEAPCVATVLVLETRTEPQQREEVAIFVACDLVLVPGDVIQQTRDAVRSRFPDVPVEKIVMSATHTHTGPTLVEGLYEIPATGVMTPTAYSAFFADRVATAIGEAWNGRQPAKVGWGLAHAAIALNRRSVYADGTAVMYGSVARRDFRMIEGYEDHGVEVLCVWNSLNQLMATSINVACPAQEVENREFVHADFWHPVREQLRAEHGAQLHVLGWTGAAGDQSPHVMFRKAAEERMRRLRGLDTLQEISRRLVAAWREAYDGARREVHHRLPLMHRVTRLELPRRQVTVAEYELAKAKVAQFEKEPGRTTLIRWHGGVVKRYEDQQRGTLQPFVMDLHTIRLGDIAIATNPFELYTDYGMQLKARSPALQTFVIQLAGSSFFGTYLPSSRAVLGGGYSAIAESNEVGPEAGQELVERTLADFDAFWPKPTEPSPAAR